MLILRWLITFWCYFYQVSLEIFANSKPQSNELCLLWPITKQKWIPFKIYHVPSTALQTTATHLPTIPAISNSSKNNPKTKAPLQTSTMVRQISQTLPSIAHSRRISLSPKNNTNRHPASSRPSHSRARPSHAGRAQEWRDAQRTSGYMRYMDESHLEGGCAN